MYGLPGEAPPAPRLADRYRDYVRYPVDGEQGSLDDVVRAAAESEQPIAEWKRRFMGAPMNGPHLAGVLERIVREPPGPSALDGARARVVLGFAEEMLARLELLRRVEPAPDTTLVVWAPGISEEEARSGPRQGTTGCRTFCRSRLRRRGPRITRWPSARRRSSAIGRRPAASARWRAGALARR